MHYTYLLTYTAPKEPFSRTERYFPKPKFSFISS